MNIEAPLDWSIAVADIPERGMEIKRSATDAEREAIARSLEILGCDRLTLSCRIRQHAGGRYALTGKIVAALSQACVVSLDPVPQTLVVDLAVEFQPEARREGKSEERELNDPFDTTEIEQIENGKLDLGRIVFEELASHRDPFPRGEGAELEKKESGAKTSGTGSVNPFAKLAALKKNPS